MTIESTPPFDLPPTDPRPDIRLIAADMDGTLLDQEDQLHEHLWPLIDELSERGIVFCPASGRQYYNLLERFRDVADRVVFMDAGQIIEANTPANFFANPQHARTKLFLSQILR